MNRRLLFVSALCAGVTMGAFAQSNQSPTLQEATSTTDTRQANPPKPILKKSNRQQRMEMEKGMDTTLPANRPKNDRKQRRLPPDSLRRGGATRVDTIR